MRVLLVTASYPSVCAPYNGVFIRRHAEGLAELGHEVCVVAPRVFRQDPPVACGDVRVVRFRYPSGQRLLVEHDGIPAWRVGFYLCSALLKTLAEARRWRPDVIHGHWVIPTGLVAVLAGRLLRRPVAVTAHRADIVIALSGSRIARALAAFTLHGADRVLAVSSRLRREVSDAFGLPEDRIVHVPMGVDTSVFEPEGRDEARARLGLPPSSDIVLFVGGLTEVKGVRDLLEALPSVLAARPSTLCVLVGRGPLEHELRSRAETLGIEDAVRFLGPLAPDEVPALMNAADVLALPSLSEGLPVCLMEAAAVGLPVVATDVGGSSEIAKLNPRSRMIPPADPASLSEALLAVLFDEHQRARTCVLQAGGIFTQDGALSRTTEVYRGLTRAARSGTA